MNAPTASALNAGMLILVSLWGYLASGSWTALIPAAFGVAIAACHPGVKAENKLVAHIAVVLTLVVLLALFNPLWGALSGGHVAGILRVGLMMASSVLALVYFVKSFIAARRGRG